MDGGIDTHPNSEEHIVEVEVEVGELDNTEGHLRRSSREQIEPKWLNSYQL